MLAISAYTTLILNQSIKNLVIDGNTISAEKEFYALFDRATVKLYGLTNERFSVEKNGKRRTVNKRISGSRITVAQDGSFSENGIPHSSFVGKQKTLTFKNNLFLREVTINDCCSILDCKKAKNQGSNAFSVTLRGASKLRSIPNGSSNIILSLSGNSSVDPSRPIEGQQRKREYTVVKYLKVILDGLCQVRGFEVQESLDLMSTSSEASCALYVSSDCNVEKHYPTSSAGRYKIKTLPPKQEEELPQIAQEVATVPDWNVPQYASSSQRMNTFSQAISSFVDADLQRRATVGESTRQNQATPDSRLSLNELLYRTMERSGIRINVSPGSVRIVHHQARPPSQLENIINRTMTGAGAQQEDLSQSFKVSETETRKAKFNILGNLNYKDVEAPEGFDGQTCNICMSHISVVVTDCGHESMCVTCARQYAIRNNECIECRAPITTAIIQHRIHERDVYKKAVSLAELKSSEGSSSSTSPDVVECSIPTPPKTLSSNSSNSAQKNTVEKKKKVQVQEKRKRVQPRRSTRSKKSKTTSK